MKKVLFVVGSLRKDSFNRQLAQEAAAHLAGKAQTAFLDIASVPLVNQDCENPVLPAVAELRRKVTEADALWIMTPEYNHSYPGLLKNAVDWLSRPSDPSDPERKTALAGKIVAVSGAAGGSAASFVLAKLTELLMFVRADVVEPQCGVTLDREAFTTNKLTLKDSEKATLQAEADALLAKLALYSNGGRLLAEVEAKPGCLLMPGLFVAFRELCASASLCGPDCRSIRSLAFKRQAWFSAEKKGSALSGNGIPLERTACLRKIVTAVESGMQISAKSISACTLRLSSMRTVICAMAVFSFGYPAHCV